MRMYQYDKHLDFHALGREIKRKREEKGWTQEYLAQLVDRTPRSIMYMENRGQKPSLNVFYQLVTLLEISVDQFFFPDKLNGESTCRMRKKSTRLRFLRPFPGERVMASWASVDTLATFAPPGAPRKCLLGSLPKPGPMGQSVP